MLQYQLLFAIAFAENAKKYRHLTWRQEGIDGAKAGMLAFISSGDDVSHVGLVTGDGTIIHSSKSAGGVIESEFTTKRLWNKLAIHRYIGTGEVEPMDTIYSAKVRTNGGSLNMRSGAGKNYSAIAKLPNGTQVDVLKDGEWAYIEYAGTRGYVDSSYLEKQEETQPVVITPSVVIVDDAGNIFSAGAAFLFLAAAGQQGLEAVGHAAVDCADALRTVEFMG